MVTYWERANLLALLYVIFSCAFVTFSCDVLGQVWYLIVSLPDLCLLTYFVAVFLTECFIEMHDFENHMFNFYYTAQVGQLSFTY